MQLVLTLQREDFCMVSVSGMVSLVQIVNLAFIFLTLYAPFEIVQVVIIHYFL